MKRNNIYRNNIYNGLIALLAIAVMAGCALNNNAVSPADSKTTDNASDFITLSGSMKIDSGRSATVNTENIQWSVEATSDTEIIKGTVSGTTWSVRIPFSSITASSEADDIGELSFSSDEVVAVEETGSQYVGSWTVTVTGSFSGSSNPVTVYKGSTSVRTSGSDNPITVSLNSDLFNEEGTGDIKLPFKAEDSSVKTVYMKDGLSEEDSVIDASADFTDNTAEITVSNVSAGSHYVTLSFCDVTGNTLYQRREIITVLADCTTDLWCGFCVKDGRFTVTEAMITNYGSDILPETQEVLYDLTYDADRDISCFAYSIGNKSINGNSFTFDKEGNVYVLQGNNNDGTVFSSKDDFEKGISVSLTKKYNITVDRKKNVLYGYYYNGETEVTLKQYPKLISSGSTDESTDYTIEPDPDQDVTLPSDLRLCVYNDILYIPYTVEIDEGYKVNLAQIPLSSVNEDTPLTVSADVSSALDIDSTDFSYDAAITDIMYQDGCIYMLIREYNCSCDGSLKLYSRGGVIRYNIINKTSEITGRTTVPISNEGKYLYLYKNGYIQDGTTDNASYVFVKASELIDQDGSSYFVDLYSPVTEFKDGTYSYDPYAFYGPAKFVGLKPKKLVIADDGVAFYTDEYGAYCYKNVNRVVTVDLESFAITESKDEDKEFACDESNGSGFLSSCGYGGNTPLAIYDSKGSEYTGIIYNTAGAVYNDQNSAPNIVIKYNDE